MKLILDLDEETVKNMQGYCQQNNISINDLVTTLFNENIQKPAMIIDKIYERDGNIEKYNNFAKTLMNYLNEATYDLEESARSDEAYETDLPMSEVFKVLNRDIIDSRITALLYKTYEEAIQHEDD